MTLQSHEKSRPAPFGQASSLSDACAARSGAEVSADDCSRGGNRTCRTTEVAEASAARRVLLNVGRIAMLTAGIDQ